VFAALRADESNLTPPRPSQRPAASIRYTRPRRGPWLQLMDFEGYEWNVVELSIPALPPQLENVRILHVTDLHLRTRWPRQLDDVVARVQRDPPDLILFTGDFVDDKRDHGPAMPLVRRLIGGLRARFGMFAILGNHDGDLLAPKLHGLGVRVIAHQRVDVVVNGSPVELIGGPGPDRLDLDEHFLHAIPPKRLGVPRIVLCHYPDLVRATRRLEPDLYLAGHTHGGQICLPNECAILTHDSLDRGLCKGAHDVDGTCLIVGRGFGFTTIPVRVFCPAEVVEVRLTPDERMAKNEK
jgi:predicted MPP superfamily phosphohydrolase